MQLGVIEKCILFVIGGISLVLASVQLGLTFHRDEKWTYCWESKNDLAASCASTPQTLGSEQFSPPAGNAALYWLLLEGVVIMIGFAFKGCHYWNESRHRNKNLTGRA